MFGNIYYSRSFVKRMKVYRYTHYIKVGTISMSTKLQHHQKEKKEAIRIEMI